MSNYTKATNFATKDTLPTGDAGKIVKGTEIDTEFNAIVSAVATKADVASPTFTGTPAAPTASVGTSTTQVATTAFVQTAVLNPTVESLTFEGATADAFETTLVAADPTADRTITFPDKAGTVAMTSELPAASSLVTSTGTYSIAGSTTLTATVTAHGLVVGNVVYLNFTSGDAVDGYYTIATVPTVNTFTITHGTSITSSGNVTGYYSNLGIISIASTEETLVGTNTNRAVTPAGVTEAVRASLVRVTSQESTSGTSVDFTSIPSWAKRITVMFSGVSTSGSSSVIIQLGTGSTTYTTSGYLGSCSTQGGVASAMSTGFIVSNSHGASDTLHGFSTIQNLSGNNWVENSVLGRSDAASVRHGGGSVALGAALTAIRITAVNGTDTFDAGSINIMYE